MTNKEKIKQLVPRPRNRSCSRTSLPERRDSMVTSPAEWPELDSSGGELENKQTF